jgi:NAD(P)-dependent dehydrogenase (short-subunit alcohol dehydrogenase family)
MNDLFSLKNKTAIVTGALGLLGKHHCIALSEAGANVVAADLNENSCKEFALTLKEKSLGIGCDIRNKNLLQQLVEQVLIEFKHIDILVNNAAINDKFESQSINSKLTKFENYPLDLWKESIEVNITGTFLCSQVIGTEMVRQKSGSIINIASTYGMVAPDQSVYIKENGSQDFFKSPSYPVTKGAVISFTKYLASYWGRTGIRVNSLSPGGVENNQDEYFIKNYSSKTILGRMAKPTDYKGALIFLASDASAYMTGANLVVDGGWTAI